MNKQNLYIFFLFLIIYLIIHSLMIYYDNEKIPNNVFQTWRTHDLSPKMKENRDKMIRENSDIKFILMDDDECREFIYKNYGNSVGNAYDSLIPGAYKADLWRYCVLHKYGGVYLDIKIRTVDGFKISSLLNKEHLVKDRQEWYEKGKFGIYNGFLVQNKGSILMKKCIDQIVKNVREKYYGSNNLYPTGPGLLANMYIELKKDCFINRDIDMKYIGDEIIVYKNKRITKSYPEYRYELKMYGTHYVELWNKKNIYK